MPTQPLLQAPIIQTGLDWLHVQSLMQHSTILVAALICIPLFPRIRAYPAMQNCIAPDLQTLCSDPHLLCSPAEIGLPPPRLPPLPPALDVRRIQASHDLAGRCSPLGPRAPAGRHGLGLRIRCDLATGYPRCPSATASPLPSTARPD